jgi:hypothetical protein
MAPNGLPLAPVGIVPGTAIGDRMGVGDLMGVAGTRLVFVELTWATAVPPPNKSMASIVRSKHCIKASCTEVKFAGTSLRIVRTN